MKKILTGLVMAGLLLGASTTQAKDVAIAVINVKEIMTHSKEAITIGESLRKEFEAREKAIVEKEKKYQTLSENLNRNGSVMTETERAKLEKEVMSLQRDLQRGQTEFREDMNLRHNEELQKFLNKVRDVLDHYAKAHNYDLVLTNDAVPYVNEKIDITKQIMEKLEGKA